MLASKEVVAISDVVRELYIGRNWAAVPAVTRSRIEVCLEDVSAIFGVSCVETVVTVLAVIYIVTRTLGRIELMNVHARGFSFELLYFGVYICNRFRIGKVECRYERLIPFLGILDVKDVVLLITQSYAAETISTTTEIIRKFYRITIRTVLAVARVVAVIAVQALIAQLTLLTVRAIDRVFERLTIFAVVGVLTVPRVETHVAVLRDGNNITVVAVLTRASPRPALRFFEVKFTEVLNESFYVDHEASIALTLHK